VNLKINIDKNKIEQKADINKNINKLFLESTVYRCICRPVVARLLTLLQNNPEL
jgi:hypothetical protein